MRLFTQSHKSGGLQAAGLASQTQPAQRAPRLHQPKPERRVRPGVTLASHVLVDSLQGVANRSSAASMAAGSVIPCCISIAARPDTWGVACEVPVKKK